MRIDYDTKLFYLKNCKNVKTLPYYIKDYNINAFNSKYAIISNILYKNQPFFPLLYIIEDNKELYWFKGKSIIDTIDGFINNYFPIPGSLLIDLDPEWYNKDEMYLFEQLKSSHKRIFDNTDFRTILISKNNVDKEFLDNLDFYSVKW